MIPCDCGSTTSLEQPQPDAQDRYSVQNRGTNRKRGIGFTNIRPVVQTRSCPCVQSRKSRGKAGAGGAVDAAAWAGPQARASRKPYPVSPDRVLSRYKSWHVGWTQPGHQSPCDRMQAASTRGRDFQVKIGHHWWHHYRLSETGWRTEATIQDTYYINSIC